MGCEALVRAGSWRDVELPARVAEVPSMLSLVERRLLYALAREAAPSSGRIVDAGCFVGGSTVALAEGLAAGGGTGPRIDVHDRFVVEPYTVGWFDGLRPGDSFLPIFEANVEGLGHLLRVRPGDIRREPFAEPIDVLHLDVLKSWWISDAVVTRAFAQLSPGSVVVQQDYWSGSCPWIPVVMEHLADHFEHAADVGSSAVFVCTNPIPAEVLAGCRWRAFVRGEALALFDRAVARSVGERRGLLCTARAQLVMEERGRREGLVVLDDVERDFAGSPEVMAALERTRRALPTSRVGFAVAVPVRWAWGGYRRARRRLRGSARRPGRRGTPRAPARRTRSGPRRLR